MAVPSTDALVHALHWGLPLRQPQGHLQAAVGRPRSQQVTAIGAVSAAAGKVHKAGLHAAGTSAGKSQ